MILSYIPCTIPQPTHSKDLNTAENEAQKGMMPLEALVIRVREVCVVIDERELLFQQATCRFDIFIVRSRGIFG